MSAATISADQIYADTYLSMRSRFLKQFGDTAEVEACLKELYDSFPSCEEYCRRKPNVNLMTVFMIMAGKVSAEKLAQKSLQRENSLLNRIKRQAAQALKVSVDLRQLAPRLVGSVRKPRLQQLSTVSR